MPHILGLFLIALAICAAATTSATPGDLDTSFGSGGKVYTAMGPDNDVVVALALQPDGKIVAVGRCIDARHSYYFCVARYDVSGALDRTFNGTGKVFTAVGTSTNLAVAAVIQPDGKIIVAGTCFSFKTDFDFCVVRYLPDGTLDNTFNGAGVPTTPIGPGLDSARALALQSDGKILVVGNCQNGSGSDACFARYTPDGALDTTFNGTGKLLASTGSTPMALLPTALVLQPDGKIVVTARCSSENKVYFCLARYLSTGALDTSFNNIGMVNTALGLGDDLAYAVALQMDGKIVVAGSCSTADNFDFCLARYLPNGALDESFNGSGKVIFAIGAAYDDARAIVLQPDGKIVVSGSCFNGVTFDFCLARVLPNGALDTSLNGSGKVISPAELQYNVEGTHALVQQSDGKVVIGGSCFTGIANDFCLARYEGGPNTPKTLTEYVYNPLSYYFLTSRDTDKALLDAAPGWARTGQSFSSLSFADPGSMGINRYYFDQIAKNQTRGSHFYTLVDSEKSALAALNPSNQPSPRLPYNEGIDSYAFLPIVEGIGGRCAAGQTPVYRAFRGQTRFPDDPNHRFTTSLTVYNQLIAQGWDGEGVKMCAPN